MSIEILVLLGAVCVTAAANVVSAVVLRSLAQRLVASAMAYRAGRSVDVHTAPAPPDDGRSPLKDVFQQYSKLTGRMADIIFQLTESRQGARDALLVAARSIQEEASLAAAAAAGQVAADQAGQELARAQTARTPSMRGRSDNVLSSEQRGSGGAPAGNVTPPVERP